MKREKRQKSGKGCGESTRKTGKEVYRRDQKLIVTQKICFSREVSKRSTQKKKKGEGLEKREESHREGRLNIGGGVRKGGITGDQGIISFP